jgi:hypothetical protein
MTLVVGTIGFINRFPCFAVQKQLKLLAFSLFACLLFFRCVKFPAVGILSIIR